MSDPRRPAARLRAAVAALSALAVAGAIAALHPLSPTVALVATAVLALAAGAAPRAWLWLWPALLPLAGLAPWTGWLTLEESDLLLAALAAGAWARHALWPQAGAGGVAAGHGGRGATAAPLVPLLLVGLPWLAVQALAAWRGWQDAGGWPQPWTWYDGYRGAANVLRLLKPALLLLWLVPLWRREQAAQPRAAALALGGGLACGFAVVSASCLLERLAYPGLLDFSSDYRTTGPFWEMHVGGAALDAWLAVTAPFALQRLRHARGLPALALWGGVMALGIYAGLTTFSRIVLLTLPLGLLLCAWLDATPDERAQAPASGARAGHPPIASPGPGPAVEPPARAADPRPWLSPWAAGTLLALLLVLAGGALFPLAGWRGLLLLLGLLTLLLPVAAPPQPPATGLARPLAAGLLTGAPVLAAIGLLLPKGPYLAAAGAGLLCLAGLAAAARPPARPPTRAGRRSPALAWSGWWLLLATLPWVALHWGGPDAGLRGALVALLPAGLGAWALSRASAAATATATATRGTSGPAAGPSRAMPEGAPGVRTAPRGSRPLHTRRAPWPGGLRWQTGAATALTGLALLVGSFGGGTYFSDRIGQTGGDEDLRGRHWGDIVQRLRTEGRLLSGVGSGRFVDRWALEAAPGTRPGDIRLLHDPSDGRATMRLVAGQHVMGHGELLRLSQRLRTRPAPGPLQLGLTLRTAGTTPLIVELCDRHLIYDGGCNSISVPLRPASAAGAWQTLTVDWRPGEPAEGRSPWPGQRVLSLATEAAGVAVDLRAITLSDASGRPLLRNGDFGAEGAAWFFSSDKHHMPWHAKNLAVHLLYEQGLIGLGAWLAGLLGALWMAARALRRPTGAPAWPLAAPLLAALVAVQAVGAIDSLLDMPRIALLLGLLTAVALQAPRPAAAR
jgi:hypothetical protein